MKKRKSVEERKEEVFYVISQIIAEKGLSEVSTVEVARRLGVSQPAIYKYFKNKDDMITYYLQHLKNNLNEIIKKAEKGKTTEEKLRIIFTEHFRLLERTKILPRVVFSDIIYVGNPEKKFKLKEAVFLYKDGIKNIISEGIKNGEIKDIDPEFGVRVVIGSILSSTLFWMLDDMKFRIIEEVDFIIENIKKTLFN
ncbi:TetR/AcrR family transcriptional regulator [Persephonella sp.]|uniref:TetR/AcrR family transcriptional regulator n=1 Tax=Persephonella sp. TaxID=2060922 RepID=UPI0025EC2734|nr:TetR/AcrR family transcriptional regulator [Persephonella sp.]